jgi:hypothetical protein
MIASLFTWTAMSMTIGVAVVLGYTTFVLHKVHAHAGRAQLATLPGLAQEAVPAPAAKRLRHSEAAPASPEYDSRPARRRPRRPWVTRLRMALVLAATVASSWATGYSRHWPALAADAAVLLLAAWLTRRWR